MSPIMMPSLDLVLPILVHGTLGPIILLSLMLLEFHILMVAWGQQHIYVGGRIHMIMIILLLGDFIVIDPIMLMHLEQTMIHI